MADQDVPLTERLKEMRAQLGWGRDYLYPDLLRSRRAALEQAMSEPGFWTTPSRRRRRAPSRLASRGDSRPTIG